MKYRYLANIQALIISKKPHLKVEAHRVKLVNYHV